MTADVNATADLAILSYGACAQCTTAGRQVWHAADECARIRREELALAAIKAGLTS